MGSLLGPYTRNLARKPHRKSRLGCQNCASASWIEGSPTDLSTSEETEENEGSFTFISSTASNFKPPKRSHCRSRSKIQQSQPQNSQAVAQRPFEFTATDMALFHHFLTSNELTGWCSRAQQEMCRIGFAHHYVLRLLLAFAGFHLAQTQANLSNNPYIGTQADFRIEAERHLNHAVREASDLIAQIRPDNSAALYVSAIFIFLSSLARGPQPGEYLAFRDDGAPGHIVLFLGIRSILELCRKDIHPSVFAIHGGHEEGGVGPGEASEKDRKYLLEKMQRAAEYVIHLTAFCELLPTLITVSDPRAASYRQSLGQLEFSLYTALRPSSTQATGLSLFPLIFAWLYQIPDEIVHDLQQREPAALILFAFFSLLLDQINRAWFINLWPRHILKGIYRHLDPEYLPYIQWIMDNVVGRPQDYHLGAQQIHQIVQY
ncbi:hypothetical protein N7540_001740 [Penicillium herquei]|nr:hypothetical protein N7540_001740 [Penicillium herquei]